LGLEFMEEPFGFVAAGIPSLEKVVLVGVE
jgi:hypothetical protein